MVKFEVSKTHGGYWRVYKITKKFAIPFSPKEFINKRDAMTWLEKHKSQKK